MIIAIREPVEIGEGITDIFMGIKDTNGNITELESINLSKSIVDEIYLPESMQDKSANKNDTGLLGTEHYYRFKGCKQWSKNYHDALYNLMEHGGTLYRKRNGITTEITQAFKEGRIHV